MQLHWIMHERVSKPGMEKQFEWLSQAKNIGRLNCESVNNWLTKISRTPKEFDDKFNPSIAMIDGGRIYSCKLVPMPLRDEAMLDHSGIGSYDYGNRLMRVVRSIRKDIKTRPSLDRREDRDIEFALARETNFLQLASRWLMIWGGRGFGYRAVQE